MDPTLSRGKLGSVCHSIPVAYVLAEPKLRDWRAAICSASTYRLLFDIHHGFCERSRSISSNVPEILGDYLNF